MSYLALYLPTTLSHHVLLCGVCVCVCTRVRARARARVCAVCRCTFPHLQYVSTCIIYVCSDLVVFILADNFGLFTEIAVCNFLRGLAMYWSETFLFCLLHVCMHFRTAHRALEWAIDHAR